MRNKKKLKSSPGTEGGVQKRKEGYKNARAVQKRQERYKNVKSGTKTDRCGEIRSWAAGSKKQKILWLKIFRCASVVSLTCMHKKFYYHRQTQKKRGTRVREEKNTRVTEISEIFGSKFLVCISSQSNMYA
jgi:hypothetical protein